MKKELFNFEIVPVLLKIRRGQGHSRQQQKFCFAFRENSLQKYTKITKIFQTL
jgi:hypothetical protein